MNLLLADWFSGRGVEPGSDEVFSDLDKKRDLGRIRYVPPEGYDPSSPLPRGEGNGYIDRFGNEWVKGPSRTPGEPYEWDVQLSRQGKAQLGWLSRDGEHINVSLGGRVTH